MLVQDAFIKSYLGDHSLALPITGTKESIIKISRVDLLEFMQNYYVPRNMVVSIAGKFDDEKFLDQVSELVKNIDSGPVKKTLSYPQETPKVSTFIKDIEQAHICLGTKGVSILNKDRYVLAIIDACLGGSMSSRLFQEIREKKGFAYSINTFEELYRQVGIFGVYAAVRNDKVQEVINLIMEEIYRLKEEGLSDKELDFTKNQLKGSLVMGIESPKYRASRNARFEIYFGKIMSIEEICNSIDSITQEMIKDLCNRIFDEKLFGLAIVGPKESFLKEPSLV